MSSPWATTSAMASLWLLPKIPRFQREHDDIELRIEVGVAAARAPRRRLNINRYSMLVQAAMMGQGVC